MTHRSDAFFVGWSKDMASVDRRFMLGAGIALVAGSAGLATALGRASNPPGDGAWAQGDVRAWSGLLLAHPYPMLRTRDLGGAPRTAFLATSGKTAVRLPAALVGAGATIKASLIARGDHAMLATSDASDWIAASQAPMTPSLQSPLEIDRGPAAMTGEILDAKCWFGAMRPGYGKAHKACAALCARGGLPLAFCEAGACGDSDQAPLFLNESGGAHGRDILPYVGDPVFAVGRLVQVGDVLQFRTSLSSIARV